MEGSADEFISSGGEETFIDGISQGLDIDASSIEITNITDGSVVVAYEITVDSQKETNAQEI